MSFLLATVDFVLVPPVSPPPFVSAPCPPDTLVTYSLISSTWSVGASAFASFPSNEGDDDAEEEAVDATSDLEAEQPAFEGKEAKADAPTDQVELMRAYVTKVSGGHGAETKGGGETGGTNTKSTVASKNDMGGEAKNIATGGEGTGGSHTGLTGNDTKEDSAGNVNVPGGKASKSLKSDSKGHGTEKKGKGEEGGTNTDSVIGS
jgi:hypothetical protein